MGSIGVIPPSQAANLNLERVRLHEAIMHLRHNTEFQEVLRHMRAEHIKHWRQYCRDPAWQASEYARGRAAQTAELYKLFTDKEIVE
jgi:hypothetical protein